MASTKYNKAYQHQYYLKRTKVKRQVKQEERKVLLEAKKEELKQNPREVTHVCPVCNKTWTEITSALKPREKKTCKACMRQILNERARLPENRQKEYAHRRARLQTDEEYKKKVDSYRKKYLAKIKDTPEFKEKLKEYQKAYAKRRKELQPVVQKEIVHFCPKCNEKWTETIQSDTRTSILKTCSKCKKKEGNAQAKTKPVKVILKKRTK